MNSLNTTSPEYTKTDNDLMTVLHESLDWRYLASSSAPALIYTNLRGALENLFEAHKKGAAIVFLFNAERRICVGVDQIKSLWKRIGLV
jgi:hypothetical protein